MFDDAAHLMPIVAISVAMEVEIRSAVVESMNPD